MGSNNDLLLFYSKSDRWIWNVQHQPHDDTTKLVFGAWTKMDEHGLTII